MVLLISLQESEATIGDKFVTDIRNYVSVVSDHAAPACLILFGVNYTFWLSLLLYLLIVFSSMLMFLCLHAALVDL